MTRALLLASVAILATAAPAVPATPAPMFNPAATLDVSRVSNLERDLP